LNDQSAAPTAAEAEPAAKTLSRHRPGSLSRRMIGVAALWIATLLLAGGFALDRVLTRSIVANFDSQLVLVLNGMLGAAEIGPDGEVRHARTPSVD